jgi:hypothetical protein
MKFTKLTLEAFKKRICTLYGRADDLEAEGRYNEAGALRDAADAMADELATAVQVLYDATQESN